MLSTLLRFATRPLRGKCSQPSVGIRGVHHSHPNPPPPPNSPPVVSNFASPTTSIGFQKLFIPCDNEILLGFLNSFIPAFQERPVSRVVKPPYLMRRHIMHEKQQILRTIVLAHPTDKLLGQEYVVEMHVHRHKIPKPLALWNACLAYTEQFDLHNTHHYKEGNGNNANNYMSRGNDASSNVFKNVISLQILYYEPVSTVIHSDEGMKGPNKSHTSPIREFVLQNIMHSTPSNTSNPDDYLRIVQCDMSQVQQEALLFPPNETVTDQQWWFSVFKHGHKYTNEILFELYASRIIPEFIYKALERLDMSKWQAYEVKKYQEECKFLQEYSAILRQEYEEGYRHGKLEIIKQHITNGLSKEESWKKLLNDKEYSMLQDILLEVDDSSC